ncbi:aspartyl protease family protein [Prosthecobacter sp.]|uniref:aspartyl protease family protein n=1 Tax=Prosthecobacter sp. TaxID=1965333 RepID=UPI0037841969
MHLRCLAIILSCFILPLRGEEPPLSAEALAGALRTSGLPTGEESVTVPLESTFLGFIVEAQINGQSVQLLLDSGAACTLLSPEIARQLGLQTNGPKESASSADGGSVVGLRTLTKRFSLGSAWTENEPVFIAEMIPGIQGLLGMATLADWDVRIDPSTRKLTLFPAGKAPSQEGETVLPLTCQRKSTSAGMPKGQGFHMMNLTVPLHVGTHELAATPDTGHGTILQLPSTLIEKMAPQALKDALPALATAVTLSGKTMSREAKLREVTFGPDTLHGLRTNIIDAPPGSNAESKGLIGLNLLRHYVMTFRFSVGELRLKPLGTVQEITSAATAGIYMDLENKILNVLPNGPADKAGLRIGDEVLEIEGHPLKTMTPEKFAAFKRLPPGTAVKVRYRRGELSPMEATLVLMKE